MILYRIGRAPLALVIFRLGWLALWLGVAPVAYAAAEDDLDAAIGKLRAAGNYTWEAKRLLQPAPTRRLGETVVNGYTLVRLRPTFQLVALGNETVFGITGGVVGALQGRGRLTWKRTRDLQTAEVVGTMPELIGRSGQPYAVTPPHEILGFLLETGSSFDSRSGVISGEITEHGDINRLANCLYQGGVLVGREKRGSWSIVRRISLSGGQGRRSEVATEEKLTFEVSLGRQGIDAFRIEYHEAGAHPVAYEYVLSEVGSTFPVVPAEAKALLR